MKFSLNKFCLGVGCLMLSLVACKKATLQVGGQYVDDSYAQITYVDSVAPYITTEYIDSFVTSGLGYCAVGNFTDPNFGKINASMYFQLQPPTYNSTFADSLTSATYDSATALVTFSSSYWYGDTTQTSTLSVYSLTDYITKYTTSSYLFNNQSFAASTTALGSKSFLFRPNSGSLYDTVSIKLSDVLGKNLYSLMANGSSSIQNTTNFLAYLHGMKISASSGTPGMGILDSVKVRIHYHKPSTDGLSLVRSTIAFGLYDKTYAFSNVTTDRTGTSLGNLNFGSSNRSIYSKKLDSTAMIQPISGAMAKIAFPNIQNFNNYTGLLKLSKAVLQIRPKRSTYEGFYTLPSALYLYQSDATNSFGYDPAGSSSYQTGSLTYDTKGAYYTWDVTNYISTMMSTSFASGDGLLIAPPGSYMGSKFNSLIFGDGSLDGYQNAVLKLYFISVNTSN